MTKIPNQANVVQKLRVGYINIGIKYSLESLAILEKLSDSFQNFILPESADVSQNLIIAIGPKKESYNPLLHLINDERKLGDNFEIFFYAPNKSHISVAERIITALESIVVQFHANARKGLLLHAATACSQGRGFIFLGKSGAGKSTLARNTAQFDIPVLGEDRIFVLSVENQQFILSIAPKYPTQITTHPELHPPLKGIFILKQAENDRLVPLSQKDTAKMVFTAFREATSNLALPPALLKNAFHLACDIARQVPGYDLYLRSSPDFWKLIDAEFPVE